MNLAGMRSKLLGFGEPIFELVAKCPLSPNGITTLALLFGLVSSIAYFYGLLLVGVLFLLSHCLMDLCDGYKARSRKAWTLFGGVYDGLVDRYINGLIIAAIALNTGGVAIPLGFIAIASALTNSFSKVATYAETQDFEKKNGKILHPMDSVGFFGLAETDIVIILFSVYSALTGVNYMAYCLAVIALGTSISLLQRAWFVYLRYNKK